MFSRLPTINIEVAGKQVKTPPPETDPNIHSGTLVSGAHHRHCNIDCPPPHTSIMDSGQIKVRANNISNSTKLDPDGPKTTDGQQSGETESPVYKRQIVWRNVMAMFLLHAASAYGFFCCGLKPHIPWYSIIFLDVLARISALGVTAGSHRLWAHRSYKARLPLRIVLMLMHTMALQNDIYDWCRDHRLHHKHSDTDADPYNARRGFFFSHMGWLLVRKHPDVIKHGKQIDLSDVWADPVVRFQRRFYIPLVILCWAFLPTYVAYRIFGANLMECFLGAVVFRYTFSLHFAWTVNSLAHMYGYQMYDTKLEPRENRLVVYASMGEGFHNYHHTYPWDYSASEHGWNKCFNLTTLFIDVCAFLGLAYDRRKPSEQLVRKRIDRTGDWQQRNEFVHQFNIVIDYLLGFVFCTFLLLLTWTIRYILNGHL